MQLTQQDYENMAGPDWPSFAQYQTGTNIPLFVLEEIQTMTDQILKRYQSVDMSTFCVLPFYGFEMPKNVSCCLWKTNKVDVQQVQQQMLSGKRPNVCSKCWALEDKNLLSDRQIKNSSLDFYLNRDLISLFEECQRGENRIIHYKIDSSNTCNAQCITCDSGSSSSWGELLRKNNLPSAKNWKIEYSEFNIDYKHATGISFRGGESTLSPANFKIIEKLVEANNTQCFLSFVTNGAFTLSAEKIQLIKQFPNVDFSFSIDGIGLVFEYLRYPLKWNKILENINWCRDQGFNVSTNHTISNLNILYFEETEKWFNSNNIKFAFNPVYEPSYYRPTALPFDVKQTVIKQTDNDVIKKFLSTHDTQDDIDFEKFLIDIKHQDQLKGTKLVDYLPEFSNLINLK